MSVGSAVWIRPTVEKGPMETENWMTAVFKVVRNSRSRRYKLSSRTN